MSKKASKTGKRRKKLASIKDLPAKSATSVKGGAVLRSLDGSSKDTA